MPSLIKLESLISGEPVEILELDSGSLTLGRAEDNAVVIDSDSVSRNHTCLFEVLGYWFLEDLNSTNGTLVNGVKLVAGQLRLLRDNDLIQLANFPIRFSEVDPHNYSEVPPPPSLLIFSGTTFETEFPLTSPGARLQIGGNEAHLFVAEYTGEQPLVEIISGPNKLELQTRGTSPSVIVNGMVVSGVTALADRDEVDVGGYKLVVNDLRSAETSKQNRMLAVIQAQREKASESSVQIQAHLGSGTDPLSRRWEVDPMKRKLASSRKFVFGTSPQEDDVTGTVSMSRQDMAFKVGEVSASKRFGQTMRFEAAEDPQQSEQKQIVVGVIVLLCLLAAVVYFFAAT